MKKFMNGIGTFFLFFLFFFGARTVVQNLLKPTDNGIGNPDIVREEMLSNGASTEAIDEILLSLQEMNNSEEYSRMEDAYGAISGTDIQISKQLDADPKRREIVAKAIIATILEYMELPIYLDEVTSVTGIIYEAANSAIVYHYTITEDLSWMSEDELEETRYAVETHNPDSACKTSLSMLKQGFDMAYSYRTVKGDEMFRVTRDYEGCQALGIF
jgi:hypothetical protein